VSSSVPFFTQAAVLDEFLRSDDPGRDPEILEVLLEMLAKQADLRDYFFRNRPNSAWVPILWDLGFFKTPPTPVESEHGKSFPFWPAQDYLLSVATEVPQYVTQHIREVSPYPVYTSRATEGLTLLPIEEVEQFVPFLMDWLDDPRLRHEIVDSVWKVVKLLARDGRSVAVKLFGILSRPIANPRAQDVNGYIVNAAAISLIKDYYFEQEEFHSCLTLLGKLSPVLLVTSLEANLLEARQIEKDARQHESPSFWWRSAVEPSSQNYHHDYKDYLCDWLRDAVQRWAEHDPATAKPVIERYLVANDDLLRRLGLHMIRILQPQFKMRIMQELLNAENYDCPYTHHEFLLLLQDCYDTLDSAGRSEVIKIIRHGPPPDRIQEVSDWAAHEQDGDKGDYEHAYRDRWILARLWMIRDKIGGNAADELQRLVAERGEPEHPDFLTWHSGAFAVADVSPVEPEQLATLNPQRLIEMVRNWEPDPKQEFGPEQVTFRGLANTIAGIMVRDPATYDPVLTELLSTRPEYAQAFLSQAAEYGKGDEATYTHWGIYVTVCENLIHIEDIRTNLERSRSMGWREARQAVVRLLESALEGIHLGRIEGLLPRIRDLLLDLINDPDPMAEDDQPASGWFGHADPMTVALNHVRPAALAALIYYAQLAAEKIDWGDDMGPGPERLEFVVRDALTSHLTDPSRAVRSVYGRFLMPLWWLDKAWVESNLDSIFPQGQSDEELWAYAAAWDAYVVFNHQFYPSLFEALRLRYQRAISILKLGYVSKTHLEPVKALASHLVFDYFKQVGEDGEGPASTLLNQFFEQAGSEHRGDAAWVLWKDCKSYASGGRASDQWWPAARSLWQLRVDRATSQNYPSDFDQEMGWFAMLLEFAPVDETLASLWPLLQGALPYVAPSGNRHLAWDAFESFISARIDEDPVRAVELYSEMYAHAANPRAFGRQPDFPFKGAITSRFIGSPR